MRPAINFVIALSLVFLAALPPRAAAVGVVRSRVSTLCQGLLSTIRPDAVVRTATPLETWTEPTTVLHARFPNDAAVARFFMDLKSARAAVTAKALVESPALPRGPRGWVPKFSREILYRFGLTAATMTPQIPIISIPAIGQIPDGHWGLAAGVSIVTVALGMLDYPIRCLAATDLGYPALLYESRPFRKGQEDVFAWQHRVRVIEPVARKIARGETLGIEAMHEQNVSEVASGVWRRWSRAANQPNYFVNITIIGERGASGVRSIDLIVDLVSEKDLVPANPGA